MPVRKADTVPPFCRVVSRLACVHTRAKCRCTCDVWYTYERMAENLHSPEARMLDSTTSRMIIAENSDVTIVLQSTKMPEPVLFKPILYDVLMLVQC